MKKRSKASLENIEERALRDEDVLAEFGEPRIQGAASVTRRKIQRVNVDFTDEMLDERAIADQTNKHTA